MRVPILTVIFGLIGFAVVHATEASAKKITTKTEEAEEAVEQTETDRTFNASINLPGISFEYKICPSMTLGLYGERSGRIGAAGGGGGRRSSSSSYTKNDTKMIGILGRYKFSGSVYTDGWYVSPLLNFVSTKLSDSNVDASASGNGMQLAVVGGYGWFFESGFNVELGLGFKYASLKYTSLDFTNKDGNADTLKKPRAGGTSGEIALGYAF